MRLTLMVPGLLWPREILHDTLFDLPLPALSLLLGRGERRWLPAFSAHDWLGRTFGLDENAFPAAALRRLGEGEAPAPDGFLCLDPVHLRLEENRVVVDDPRRLGLTADEDADLRALVAPLFAGIGELTAAVPGHWHLRLSEPPPPGDRPLPDGTIWRRLIAEAEPLLHAHPVNRARREAGRPTANSLRPWGPGCLENSRLDAALSTTFDETWGDDSILAGLSKAAGIPHRPLPLRFEPPAMNCLALYDGLTAPFQSSDALGWREALARLDGDWLAPALAALRSGSLRALRLAAPGDRYGLELDITRAGLWKFWRRPQPATALAP